MKVLFLSNEYGPNRSGSAYTHRLLKLTDALKRQNISADFISLREQRVGRPILAQAVNAPLLRKRVAGYDFVHAGGNAAYTAALLKPFTKARIIHDVHGDSVSEAQIKWAGGRNVRSAYELLQAHIADAFAYRFADYSLVVSRPLWKRIVRERHIRDETIGLVRNGVDLSLFRRPPMARRPGEDLLVCYAGGFQQWQGVDNLVSAFELLHEEGVRLKIIGFTAQHAPLRAEIAARLGARAELLDKMPQDALISQLAAAHVLIIPRPRHRAVEVAFPTKFSEYLALGKPVIVCDVDETADLVREHNCGMVSAPNPAALAETIRAMSALEQPELEQMGQNARCLAEREFSWEQIGAQYVELLRKWSAS
jgi:glycosyltransferase involved in cell wall biosynthesis